jgi:hypothetical protein
MDMALSRVAHGQIACRRRPARASHGIPAIMKATSRFMRRGFARRGRARTHVAHNRVSRVTRAAAVFGRAFTNRF